MAGGNHAYHPLQGWPYLVEDVRIIIIIMIIIILSSIYTVDSVLMI